MWLDSLPRQKQLRFPPGQRWEYSNSNYVILAQIVTRVSGESFPQFVRYYIFQPLGMNDSFVYDTPHDQQKDLRQAMFLKARGFKPADRIRENRFRDGSRQHLDMLSGINLST